MSYREITSDLIYEALDQRFDVITHGCNCFCTMGAGIAVPMNKHFKCNDPAVFKLEASHQRGNPNKLGCIENRVITATTGWGDKFELVVVNSYTQYHYGAQGYKSGKYNIPLDYDALTMCMRKINMKYPGKHIGLPQIGCNLAGGDWNRVEWILRDELKDMQITIVKYQSK